MMENNRRLRMIVYDSVLVLLLTLKVLSSISELGRHLSGPNLPLRLRLPTADGRAKGPRQVLEAAAAGVDD